MYEVDGIELTREQALKIYHKVEIEAYKEDVLIAINRYYKNDKEAELLTDEEIECIAEDINETLEYNDFYHQTYYNSVCDAIDFYLKEKREYLKGEV